MEKYVVYVGFYAVEGARVAFSIEAEDYLDATTIGARLCAGLGGDRYEVEGVE